MDEPPSSKRLLLHHSHGVYFSESLEPDLPLEIEMDGLRYQRFLDYIYIPSETEELSNDQILAVNELRHRLLLAPGARAINERTRGVFGRAVEIASPRSLLEIGPGTNPLFRSAPKGVQYWLADMSRDVIDANRSYGLPCFYFNQSNGIPLADSAVEMIIAIFVLQFNLTSEQIAELARIMAPSGVMVGNVYRRSEESRERLLEMFMGAELQAVRIGDPLNLCRGHEYWLVFKDVAAPVVAKLRKYLG